MSKQKKGNVIIVVICLAVALMTMLVYLLKSTTTRIYTTKKLGNTLYARELANTLASISVKYLKQLLIDENSDIVKVLSLPFNNFTDSSNYDLLFAINDFKDINNNNVLSILKTKSGLKALKIEKLYWNVKKEDFNPIYIEKKHPYTREKYGLIHIYMTFSYLTPGKSSEKDRSKETYHFVSDVCVVANLLPILSRFSLYIDDALDGDTTDLDRFNVIESNENGEIRNNKYMPWILNNYGEILGPNKNLKSVRSILDSSIGLIFLGGAKPGLGESIRLGLSFGEAGAGTQYGEGLHFYSSEKTGYWRNQASKEDFSKWGNNTGMLTCNFGLCHETSSNPDLFDDFEDKGEDEDCDDNYNSYFEMTGGKSKDKLNSIFKLYGTDDHPSPTLVLGYVDAKYAAIKQFRYGDDEDNYCLLSHYDNEEDFKVASRYDYDTQDDDDDDDEDDDDDDVDDFNDEDLTDFAFRYRDSHSHNKLEYEDYLNLFSSRIECDNYNKGYAFALNNAEEFPFKKNIIEGEEFKNIYNRLDENIFVTVPSPYNDIYTDSDVKLGELSKFADLNQINDNKNNVRIGYVLTLTEEDNPDIKSIDCFHPSNDLEKDILKFLKYKSILLNDKINFNGWLYIKNETTKDIEINFTGKKLISNGGIILSNGNLHIKSDILSDSNNKKCLTLMTLGKNNDIIIEPNVTNLDASLVSMDGQVILKGSWDVNDFLKVNGNIIMKKIRNGKDGINAMRRGVRLNYNNNLSALPFKENTNEEKNTLMFNINDKPKIMKHE